MINQTWWNVYILTQNKIQSSCTRLCTRLSVQSVCTRLAERESTAPWGPSWLLAEFKDALAKIWLIFYLCSVGANLQARHKLAHWTGWDTSLSLNLLPLEPINSCSVLTLSFPLPFCPVERVTVSVAIDGPNWLEGLTIGSHCGLKGTMVHRNSIFLFISWLDPTNLTV